MTARRPTHQQVAEASTYSSNALLQLKTIAERLEKLEFERQELLEYQRLDRKRRAIEYCILDNDRTETMQHINRVCSICTVCMAAMAMLIAFLAVFASELVVTCLKMHHISTVMHYPSSNIRGWPILNVQITGQRVARACSASC